MNRFFRLPASRSLLPLLAILLASTIACSQNEYSWQGAKPPAPKNPRNAHIIKKEGSGMNAVSSMEAQETPAGTVFKGSAQLSRGLESVVKPGATLFIIVRSLDQNPTPVAAAKIKVDKFPVEFQITEQDAMQGGPLPNQADILLRLDDDGDLTTKHPGDLVGGPVRAKSGEGFPVLLAPPEQK